VIDFGGGVLSGAPLLGFLARLDPAGEHVFSGSYPIVGDRFAMDATESVIVAGTDKYSSGTTLAKLDPSGKQAWSRKLAFGHVGGYPFGDPDDRLVQVQHRFRPRAGVRLRRDVHLRAFALRRAPPRRLLAGPG
jgi:hypothetical protein